MVHRKKRTEDVRPLTWLNSLPSDLPADCAHLVGAILKHTDGTTGYVIASVTALAEFGHIRRNKIKPALDVFIARGYMRLESNGYYKDGKSKTYRVCRPISVHPSTNNEATSVPLSTNKDALLVSQPGSISVPTGSISVHPSTHSQSTSPQMKRTSKYLGDLSIKDEDQNEDKDQDSESFWVGRSKRNPNGYFISQGEGKTRPNGSREVTLNRDQRKKLFQSGLSYPDQLELILGWAGFNPEPSVPPDQNPAFREKREDFIDKIRKMRGQAKGQ